MLFSAASAALPALTTVRACASFSTSFTPYLAQLSALPARVLAHLTSPSALYGIYASTNPAIASLAFTIALFPVFLLASEINGNYSQVDRVWSILPTVFNAHYALWARANGYPSARVDCVLAFSTAWSVRLTYNYWRKGGYEVGSEDYRWEIIKARIGRWGFFALNLGFISTLQLLILWAVTTPTYLLLLTSQITPSVSSATDAVFTRVLLALVAVEYFADGQMWDYQQAKKEYQRTAKVPVGWTQAQMERGFITNGLWRYSRHPNFAAEQAIWVLLYIWGCVQTETRWNWTVVGAVFYVLVFQGSTPLTEAISSGKYPEYKLYQQRVGKFLPKLVGRRWREGETEKKGQ